MKLLSSIAAAYILGASMLITPQAADANEQHHHRHHELRIRHHELHHDIHKFNHFQMAYNREWHHARRIYNREEFGYPRVIPTYGYNNRHPGFGIQFRF